MTEKLFEKIRNFSHNFPIYTSISLRHSGVCPPQRFTSPAMSSIGSELLFCTNNLLHQNRVAKNFITQVLTNAFILFCSIFIRLLRLARFNLDGFFFLLATLRMWCANHFDFPNEHAVYCSFSCYSKFER